MRFVIALSILVGAILMVSLASAQNFPSNPDNRTIVPPYTQNDSDIPNTSTNPYFDRLEKPNVPANRLNSEERLDDLSRDYETFDRNLDQQDYNAPYSNLNE